MGLYDQAVWRYSRFLPLYNTVKERIILGDHLTLTLPLFAPLFYIWDDARALLIAQAMILCLSILPVYFIALRRLKSGFLAFFISFIYSLFYGIQYGIYFDFHPIMLGLLFLAMTAMFLEYRCLKLFVLFLILSLLTQENMGIAVFCLGLIYIFRKGFLKIALVMMVIGFLYSLIAAKIVAYISPTGFQYWPQINMNPGVFVRSLFDSPEKRQVWSYSYSAFSFVPLLSLGSVLAVATDLAQYFVTGPEFSRMWSPFMHHRAVLAIFLAIGSIDAVSIMRNRKLQKFVVFMMFLIAIVLQYVLHLPLNKLAKREYWREDSWMADTRKIISLVPKDASVATQQNLVSHLSHRKGIYLIWPRQHDFPDKVCGQVSCWWFDFGGDPDYLVVDTRPNQWLTQILETNEHFAEAIRNMEKSGKIALYKQQGDAKIYKIKNNQQGL